MIRSISVCRQSRDVAAAVRKMSSEAVAASDATSRCIDLEDRYGAHNYNPLPVVLSSGKGASFFLLRGSVISCLTCCCCSYCLCVCVCVCA